MRTTPDVTYKIASIHCDLIKQDWHVDIQHVVPLYVCGAITSMLCRHMYGVPSHVCCAVTCMWCRHMYVEPSQVCCAVTCMWCRHMYVVRSHVCCAVTYMWCRHMYVVPSHVCGAVTCMMYVRVVKEHCPKFRSTLCKYIYYSGGQDNIYILQTLFKSKSNFRRHFKLRSEFFNFFILGHRHPLK